VQLLKSEKGWFFPLGDQKGRGSCWWKVSAAHGMLALGSAGCSAKEGVEFSLKQSHELCALIWPENICVAPINFWTVWFDFDLPHIFIGASRHRRIYMAYIHRWRGLTDEYRGHRADGYDPTNIGDKSYRFHFPFALARHAAHISHFHSRSPAVAASSPPPLTLRTVPPPLPCQSPLARSPPLLGHGVPSYLTPAAGRSAKLH
jgi:hypothetical protein